MAIHRNCFFTAPCCVTIPVQRLPHCLHALCARRLTRISALHFWTKILDWVAHISPLLPSCSSFIQQNHLVLNSVPGWGLKVQSECTQCFLFLFYDYLFIFGPCTISHHANTVLKWHWFNFECDVKSRTESKCRLCKVVYFLFKL